MPDNLSSANNPKQMVDHLFRHEAGRIASVLTCLFGFDRVDLAQDIVQETMIQALQSWSFKGIPDNPKAWLYQVARNKATDVLRRESRFRQISSEVAYLHQYESNESMAEHYFLDDEIADSQLRMLFGICHPAIAVESQLAMCLKLLGGLTVHEIAVALLTNDETITKRIYRAKEKIRANEIRLEVPTGPQLTQRLDIVLKSIYLLFNEGYNSSHPDSIIRRDLCEEAMRLGLLLTQIPTTCSPAVYALLSLMCFQSARFDARMDEQGAIILLPDQDRSRWNKRLIDKGRQYLDRSAEGNVLTEYHIEARIAGLHCMAPTYCVTDWASILFYYDLLLRCKPSPIVALHRAVALAKVDGAQLALAEVLTISGLESNHVYAAVLGDLYEQCGQKEQARQAYYRAEKLATSVQEKKLMQQKRTRIV